VAPGFTRAAGLALVTALAACGDDDSFSPTVETVAGSYAASTFTLSTSIGTINLLAGGATITVTLASDGSTTGRLFMPGADEDGSDLDEDLSGTWTLTGDTVTFDQSADTFIPDVEFTATSNRLTGEDNVSGGTLRLVLTKAS
jgi:hypothetical protein